MQAPILVALEAVPEASIVIGAALALAARSQTPVLVLSVREREYTRGLVWDRRSMTDIEEVINSAIFEFERAGVRATGLVRAARSGGAAQAIVDTARRHRAAAIVMGTSGRSPLGSLIFSSVSPRVVRMSDVPLVLVPTRKRKPVDQPVPSISGSGATPKR